MRANLITRLKEEWNNLDPVDPLRGLIADTIDALAEAQQQEPVAWGMPSAGDGFVVDCITPEEHDRVEGGYTIPLYEHPPASKPLSCYINAAGINANDSPHIVVEKLERAIEAAHGIKGDA